jgi:hypothetical protein
VRRWKVAAALRHFALFLRSAGSVRHQRVPHAHLTRGPARLRRAWTVRLGHPLPGPDTQQPAHFINFSPYRHETATCAAAPAPHIGQFKPDVTRTTSRTRRIRLRTGACLYAQGKLPRRIKLAAATAEFVNESCRNANVGLDDVRKLDDR